MRTEAVDVEMSGTIGGPIEYHPVWVDWVTELFSTTGGSSTAQPFEGQEEHAAYEDLPLRLKIVIQLAQALAHYNMAYDFHDTEAQAEVQQLMVRRLEKLTRELATTKPDPEPWHTMKALKPDPTPWRVGRLFKPQPDPWAEWQEMPRERQLSQEIFRALALYKAAFGFDSEEAREQVQAVVERQLQSFVKELADVAAS